MAFNPIVSTLTLTIGSGATISSTATMGGGVALAGVITPSSFTSTILTLNGGFDAGTLFPLYNSGGTQLSVTVSTSRFTYLSPTDVASLPPYVQLQTSAAEAAARVATIIVRPF